MSEVSPEQKANLEIGRHSSTAVHLYLGTYAVSMFDLDDPGMSVASGTLVDAYGHLFLATAAHCIPDDPNGRLWLITEYPRRPDQGLLGFLNFGRHPDLDVGFLELDPSQAQGYFRGKHGCPIDRLQPAGPGRERAAVTLIGTPAERVDTSRQHAGLPAMAARVDSYSTVVLSPHEWPTPPPGNRPAQEPIDIFLEYPKEVRNLADNTDIKAYHPGGFSGGGFWDQHVSGEGFWTPEKATLFGIQSSWNEAKRYLRGVQIIHWLRLIHQHYPGIRTQLEQQFPGTFA